MAKKKEHNDMKEFAENFSKMAELYNESLEKTLEKDGEIFSQYEKMSAVWGQIAAKIMENPDKLYDRQMELAENYFKVWENAWSRYIGEEQKPLYEADAKDRRFKDESWNNDVTFDFIKQSYLLTKDWMAEVIGDIKGLDNKTAEKFEFYCKQFADAMSPSNFAFTNPTVIKETIETKGENLVKGMQNMLHDLDDSKQFLQVTTADKNAFKLGENIAATPGKVIYKNDLIELIQYEPVCKQAYQVPLLIIPAWINKYYILDLSANNSFVKWATEQGYTVFMISWVNPTRALAHKKFDDYMLEGPMAAIDAIEKATGQREVNALGYCLGGTLLACTLAYMKSKKDERIKAATFLTTMVDFGDVGDMSVFIDEKQLDELDEQMREHGYLDGSEIAAIFSAIRANDLIWTFVVNNYLLGREPMQFDILYWNSDATRLPADTHSFYLRNMYLKNLLPKPGGISLDDTLINVGKVDTPSYILATEEDHIAPWKTTFETTKLFRGKTKFVLAGSGHVAGVINHPAKNKYSYVTNDQKSDSADKWLAEATRSEGSWWNSWNEWNAGYSGEKIAAPKPGSGKLKPIGDAPGEYVKEC